MRKFIEKFDINKYRTRKQMIHMGWCHLKDGLVLLLSLGKYRGAYSAYASENLLRNAMNMRKTEQAKKDAEAEERKTQRERLKKIWQEAECKKGTCNCAMH